MSRESIAKSGARDGGETGRQRRGIDLFYDGYFERLSRDVFLVQGITSSDPHIVDLSHDECDCKDFYHHKHIEGFLCYHLIGTNLYAEWLRQSTKVIAPIFGRVDDSGAA